MNIISRGMILSWSHMKSRLQNPKKCSLGFAIIELLIGLLILATVLGAILGTFNVINRFYKDGIALVNSQGVARLAIESISRSLRHGQSFTVTPGGTTLTVTKYDGSVDTFVYAANSLQKNGNTIAHNVYGISGNNIFEAVVANQLIGINFAVRNEGMFDCDKEVRINTQISLRN